MNKTYAAKVVDDAVVITVEESLGMGRYDHTVFQPIPIHEWDELTYQVDMILNRDKPSLICGEHKLPEPCTKCAENVSPELLR